MKKAEAFKVWECKIVVPGNVKLPEDLEYLTRWGAINAVQDAGIDVICCFSGWGGELTQGELTLAKFFAKGVLKNDE